MNKSNKKNSSPVLKRGGRALIIMVLLLPGCKQEPLTLPEQVTAMLTSAAAWESPTVTVDGLDRSDVYKDFSITFEKDTYATTSGAPMWAPSGTWAFANEEATFLLLDEETEVEISTITDDVLELSLLWDEDTFEAGRGMSVKGKHKFKFKKKKK